MQYLADDGKGKFFVSMPDNCGVLDALAHLRGTDNLLFDMLEEPDRVKAAAELIQKALQETSAQQFDIIREKLMTGLSSKGLYLIINDAESEDEARAIIKKVEQLTRE